MTREILAVKQMCKNILTNQEKSQSDTSDGAQMSDIKRLLPIKSQDDLDHVHQEMLSDDDFKTNLVSFFFII